MEFESADLGEASYFSYPSSSSAAAHSPPYRRGIPRLVVSLAPSLYLSSLSLLFLPLSTPSPPPSFSLLSLFLSLIHGDPQE